MSDKEQVKAVVVQFFEAMNADDTSRLPLSEHVEHFGILMSDPVCGESEVRQHLQDIAPFMLRLEYGEMIIDGGSVAVLAEFEVVNQVRVNGAYFLQVEDGKLSLIRAVFDSHPLMSGRSD